MKKRKLTRRELFKALAAGGVLTATGLWMPGEKTISIPSGKVFTGYENYIRLYAINGTMEISIPVPEKGHMTVQEFYSAVCDRMDSFEMMGQPMPVVAPTSELLLVNDGYRFADDSWCHLRRGTVYERETNTHMQSRVALGPVNEASLASPNRLWMG